MKRTSTSRCWEIFIMQEYWFPWNVFYCLCWNNDMILRLYSVLVSYIDWFSDVKLVLYSEIKFTWIWHIASFLHNIDSSLPVFLRAFASVFMSDIALNSFFLWCCWFCNQIKDEFGNASSYFLRKVCIKWIFICFHCLMEFIREAIWICNFLCGKFWIMN